MQFLVEFLAETSESFYIAIWGGTPKFQLSVHWKGCCDFHFSSMMARKSRHSNTHSWKDFFLPLIIPYYSVCCVIFNSNLKALLIAARASSNDWAEPLGWTAGQKDLCALKSILEPIECWLSPSRRVALLSSACWHPEFLLQGNSDTRVSTKCRCEILQFPTKMFLHSIQFWKWQETFIQALCSAICNTII